MAKISTKGKTRRKPRKLNIRRVAASAPRGKAHAALLKVVARGVVVVDALTEKARQAEAKLEAAGEKVAKKVRAASRKRTAAALRAIATSKSQAKKVSSTLVALRARLRSEEKALKAAAKAAETERKKEDAKQKAVAGFAEQWERAYLRSMAKRKRRARR